MSRRSSRRQFLQQSAAAGIGFWVAGGLTPTISRAANEQLNIACIGVGGKGSSDVSGAAKVGNIVALCDIDENHLGKKAEQHPKALKFHDFRKMLQELEKSIDAVTVSTPDHTHAPASMMALKMRKHVYCQKPLTHTVFEARRLREVAKEMGVCTQMGNQGTASDGLRAAAEHVQADGIGPVREAHVWTNRPIWPQAPGLTSRPKEEPVPAHVHWEEFLGPAPFRPYAKGYHPFSWRGFWDFGTGALGDMACHTANMAFMALKLAHPLSVAGECGEINPETYPAWARITFQFPARETMPEVKFVWYEGKTPDGKNVLPSPELVKGQGERKEGPAVYFKDAKWYFSDGKKPKVISSGSFLVGEKATLFSPDDYGSESYLITPDAVTKLTSKPEKLPRNGKGDDGMKAEWGQAIKSNKPSIALSNFDYAGMLTETILLGNVAMRAGKKLEFDGPSLKFTNDASANHFLHYEYRKGWTL
jgi:predicted dehydrogenase